MEERTTVVIDIQLDENKVAERLAAVNSEMEELKTQNKELKKAIKEGDDALGQNSKQLADNEAKLKSLKAEQSALSGQVSTLTKSNRNYGTSIKELSAKLADMKDQYRSLSAEERDSAKGQEFLQKIQELDAEVKAADYSIGNFQRNVGNYPDAVKPVTAQLREMTQQLVQLRMEGKANTEEYNELLKKTGEMKDAMMDAQNEVKQMASDTSTLNSVLAGAQAAAGAFSVALGIMNLTGDKDSETAKELAEAQRKLQSAIAITTGLQALQNALQKESALMMGINKLRMLAAAAAQRAYAAATRDAEAAQAVFNKVAKSNIYVWLASVILTVVGAIAAFTRGSKEQKDELEKVNVELQHQADLLKKLQDGYDTLSQRANDAIESHIERLKAEGASTEEIRQLEDQLFDRRAEEFRKEEDRLWDEITMYGHRTSEYEKNLDKMNELMERRLEFLRKGDTERARFYQNEINDLQAVIDMQKKHLDIVNDFWKRRDDFYNQRKQQEAERKREDEENARKAQEAARKRAEELKREREEIKRNREELKKANDELLEFVDELKKGLAPTGEGDFFDKLKAKYEAVDKAAREAQERHELLRRFILETKGIDIDAKLDDSIMGKLEREANPLYNFSQTYKENAQAIQETNSALESSFSSLSSMYQQMANDESKTEEERAKAAKKAKAWAGIQVASNAGAAMAKGVAAAMDAPTLVGKFAALATMTSTILAAIAQAKSLLAEAHEHGGVIGGKFVGATSGNDNVLMTGRRGELVLNADQQKRLYDIANGSASSNITASLVEALQAMPAPVLVYSELKRFENNVNILDELSNLN